MKPISPAVIDFRTTITPEIDLVLTAKARALGVDKSSAAREVLAKWAVDELAFADVLAAERERAKDRAVALRKKPLSRRVQNAVFKRDGFLCSECGTEPDPKHLHIDHIVPLAAGGSNELSNLRVLCRACNLSKADKIVSLEPERGRR